MSTEHPQQSIKGFICFRREKGEVQAAAGLNFLLLMCVLLAAQLQIFAMSAVSHNMEDALAASNLASAVIDIREYGISHRILIKDFDKAYELFCIALKQNLGLNDRWEKENGIMISGKVQIECYILYNVYDGLVYTYQKDQNGNMNVQTAPVGTVTAPNGRLIETTSIYSELSFLVHCFPGVEQTAHKGKLVDICSDQE